VPHPCGRPRGRAARASAPHRAGDLGDRRRDPTKILQRGFATVSKNGGLVTSEKKLQTGDEVIVGLADGTVGAKID
jgi:exonuclease VII large subunit